MNRLQITLKIERTTKNTIRYEEVVGPTEAPRIKNLYIQKYVFAGSSPPEEIQVTIEEA